MRQPTISPGVERSRTSTPGATTAQWSQRSASGRRHSVPVEAAAGQVTAKCGAEVVIDPVDWYASPLCRACLYGGAW